MVERKYPTRNRNKVHSDIGGAEKSVSAVAKALANAEAKRTATKRIPALTTSRTFGQRSPIVNADIQAFLTKCMSPEQWNKYNDGEKQAILNSLPTAHQPRLSTSTERQLDDPPLSQHFCEGDKFLKQAVARFKRDLSDGYYEKAWLNKANQAHQERLDGKFDEYIKQHTAEMFVDEEEDDEQSAEDTDDGSYGDTKGKTGQSRKARKS